VFPARASYVVPLPGGSSLCLGERPLVMGILNVTPDSFADVDHLFAARAVDAALAMSAAGADIIDVGAESTRPGAAAIDAEEELRRLLPVLRGLAGRLGVPVSVDTYKAQVARIAVAEGAAIINDVSALHHDPAMAAAVADTGAALVLMHTRGRSDDMYRYATYGDVVADVGSELRQAMTLAARAGVPADRIIVDPGIGFAKRPAHSYGLLAGIGVLADLLHRPVLVGPSRKSFMREALDDRPAVDRDWGTAAAVTTAVLGGAHIVRVHAVAEMRQVIRVAEATRRHGRIDDTERATS
jgi:dihydropteroate synthase